VTFEVSVLAPGDPPAVFAFFEDPQSMTVVPGVKSVRGSTGPDGVVVVEGEDGGAEQHVIEFDPPHRTVVRTEAATAAWSAIRTEENRYTEVPGGTRVLRTVTVSVRTSKRRRQQSRLDAVVNELRERNQQILEALVAAFASRSPSL
jgi:hypothetical protein